MSVSIESRSKMRQAKLINPVKFWLGKKRVLGTHGFTRGKTSKFWLTWSNMKRRCLDPKSKGFKDYGDRGIIVSDSWSRFENFRDDMLPWYIVHVIGFGERNTTLDRKDNNGNYEKDNCKWSTMEEQSVNKRSNRFLEFDGKKMTIMQWTKFLGLKGSILSQRLNAYKWSIEKALTYNQ